MTTTREPDAPAGCKGRTRRWVTLVVAVAGFHVAALDPAAAGARPAAALGCQSATEVVDGGRWSRVGLPPLGADQAVTERSLDDQWHVSVSRTDPRVIYVYNVVYVFKSTDGGCTWHESFSVYSGNPNPAAYWSDRIVAVHAPGEDGAPAYLLLDRGGIPSLGMLRSGADEWEIEAISAGGAPLAGSPSRLWVAPGDPRTLYVALPSALVRSLDGGASWQLRHAFAPYVPQLTWWATDISCPANNGTCPLVDVRVMEIDPGDADALWTATEDGVFHSEDGGASWRNVHRATFGTLGRVHRIDLFRDRGGLRVAVFGPNGIAWTSEGGQTWELRKPPFGLGANGGRPPGSLVRAVDSARAEGIVAVLDHTSSYGRSNVVAQRGRRWTPIAPEGSTCGSELETMGDCLDGVVYVPRARSYYAIEIDGSHLWALEPRG